MKRFAFLLISITAILSALAQGTPRITTHLDSIVMTMGSTTTLTVEVRNAEAAELVGIPTPAPDGSGYAPFGMMEIVNADSVITSDNGNLKTYKYTLQAFEPGMHPLPPFGVILPGGDTLLSDITVLRVLPIDVDTVTMALQPLAGPASIPLKWHDWIPLWLLWVLAAAAIIAIAYVAYTRFRRHKELIMIERNKPLPPYELAIKRLEELRLKRLAESGHEKEFYTELTDILRQYLDGRFGINAMEMTSSQILKAMRKNPQTRLRSAQMDEVLQMADFVKFAKERPLADDNQRALMRATEFVAETKPVPPPEITTSIAKESKSRAKSKTKKN